jgi:hypothetical protein
MVYNVHTHTHTHTHTHNTGTCSHASSYLTSEMNKYRFCSRSSEWPIQQETAGHDDDRTPAANHRGRQRSGWRTARKRVPRTGRFLRRRNPMRQVLRMLEQQDHRETVSGWHGVQRLQFGAREMRPAAEH